MKLSLNNLLAMEQAAFSASLGVVVANGVDVETFMAVLRGSAMHAKQFDKKLPKMIAHDYSNANFHTRHLLKDCALFLDEAAAAGLITAPQQVNHPPPHPTLQPGGFSTSASRAAGAVGGGEGDYGAWVW